MMVVPRGWGKRERRTFSALTGGQLRQRMFGKQESRMAEAGVML